MSFVFRAGPALMDAAFAEALKWLRAKVQAHQDAQRPENVKWKGRQDEQTVAERYFSLFFLVSYNTAIISVMYQLLANPVRRQERAKHQRVEASSASDRRIRGLEERLKMIELIKAVALPSAWLKIS